MRAGAPYGFSIASRGRLRAGFWYKGEVARRCILSWFMLVPLAFTLACGSPSAPGEGSQAGAGGGGDAPRDPSVEPVEAMPPIEPTRPGVDPSDPSLEVDPQLCATDADCMIGTPRRSDTSCANVVSCQIGRASCRERV